MTNITPSTRVDRYGNIYLLTLIRETYFKGIRAYTTEHTGLVRKILLFLLLVTFFLSFYSERVFAVQFLTPEEKFWTIDSGREVASIVYSPDGSTVYIGGNFTRVAPYTGSGVPFSITNNQPQQFHNFPKVSGGSVNVAISDGQGGWYIGGNFKKVGDQPRGKIAHILSDGSVDQNLSLFVNNSVNSLVFDSTAQILYVGGKFTLIDGQTRNRVASINTSTGQLTNWNPNVGNQDAYISAIALDATHNIVYIGGYFSTVGGQQRINLAGINGVTGLVASTILNTDYSVLVFEMDQSNDILYVGGFFSAINGQTRRGLASIDVNTGQLSDFNVSTSGFGSSAEALALDSQRNLLYVGGYFPPVATGSVKRLFAVNTLNSQTTNWNPIIIPGSSFRALSLDSADNLIYVGGNVGYNNGQSLSSLSSVDTRTGEPTSWDPAPTGYVNTLGSDRDNRFLYVGGEFGSLGGEKRNGIASFSVESGRLTNWNPGISSIAGPGAVLDMGLDPQKMILYVGGGFTSIDGQPRSNLASFNIGNGQLTNFNPVIDLNNGSITTLALDSASSTLYIGGHFTSIGGQSRNRIGSVDTRTGEPTSWNPAPTSTLFTVNIFKLVLDKPNNLVYVGGFYDSMGGQPRKNIAAVDAKTALATNWNPKAWNPSTPTDFSVVFSLDLDAPNHGIYVGGSFRAIGNSIRIGLASVDTITGLANSWNPSPVNSDPNILDMVNNTSENIIYTAQSSSGSGTGIIGIDTITGETLWDPKIHYTGGAVAFDPLKKLLYVGGPFSEVDTQMRRGFAVFASPIDTSGNTSLPAEVSAANKIFSLSSNLFNSSSLGLFWNKFTNFAELTKSAFSAFRDTFTGDYKSAVGSVILNH